MHTSQVFFSTLFNFLLIFLFRKKERLIFYSEFFVFIFFVLPVSTYVCMCNAFLKLNTKPVPKALQVPLHLHDILKTKTFLWFGVLYSTSAYLKFDELSAVVYNASSTVIEYITVIYGLKKTDILTNVPYTNMYI